MPIAEATTQTEYVHIVRTPTLVGGEARIAGHRIRVRDIVAARDLGGYLPEEIAVHVYPQLTLGQVYSALAYYEDHRAEIDQAEVNETESVAQFIQQHPGLVRDLRDPVERRAR